MHEIPGALTSSASSFQDFRLNDDDADVPENEGLDADGHLLDDDWADWDPGDESEPLTNHQSEAYRFADNRINGLLHEKLAAREPENKPIEFLSLVAQNTNPGWASFAWDNFVQAIKACFEAKSLSPLLNLGLSLNCVYCTRAVDLTLHQAFSGLHGNAEQPHLIQVAEGRPAAFTSIFHDVQSFSSRNGDARYLEQLKDAIKPGQRACITVPVTGVKGRFSHAMNLINLGPASSGAPDRIFIICGQSGRVFDLQNDSDTEAFYARHTNDSPDDYENDVKYAISSNALEEAESTLQELALAKVVKSDLPSTISAFV